MQHLTMEELARLVDDPLTDAEAEHLARCEECAAELTLLRDQTAALAELPALEPPPAVWERVHARLQAEASVTSPPPIRRVSGVSRLLRAASYIGVLLAGAAGGFAAGARGGGVADPDLDVWRTPVPASESPLEVAEHRLRMAEAEYTAALAHFAELAGSGPEVDPVTRLTALDGIVLTTGAALEETPADPVLNGYFLSAVGQRDAILRQIAQSAHDGWF